MDAFDPFASGAATAVAEPPAEPAAPPAFEPFKSGEAEPAPEPKAAPDFRLNEEEFTKASPWERLKMMLSHPWDKYVASVDQGFKGIVEPTPVKAPEGEGLANRAEQVGAAGLNIVQGIGTGAVSPGAALAVVNPATIAYSIPRFVVGGIEDIIDAFKGDKGLQERLEKGVGGAAMVAGSVTGAAHIAEGLHSPVAPKTPTEAIDLIKQQAATTEDPQAKAALEAAAIRISDKAKEGVFEPFASGEAEPVAPVDIGPRDETVSTGNGVETPKEAAMMAEWKASIAKELEQPTSPTTAADAVAETTGQTDFDFAAPQNEPIAKAPVPEPGEPSTYGIAARVSEARTIAGHIDVIEPGEGIAAQAAVEHGRELLKAGGDADKALADFTQTGAISADGVALARARGEQLAKAAKDAADKFGVKSPEYEAAAKADSEWVKAIKPMQTEWHKIGQAQQGETEIDTGTFHGLRRAFQDATGKDFTPEQADAAEGIAEGVKKATEEAAEASEKVIKAVREAKPTSDAMDIWNRAKKYIDAGETDFDALRHKIASDTGMPVSEVTRFLAEPKQLKVITDDMYAKLAARRRVVMQAKNWLNSQAMPGWLRFTRAIPRAFFAAKVFGHGTVGMITHAGLNIFHPEAWARYWPNFFRQFKLLGMHDKGAYHEMMMQNLAHDPNYNLARRSGLANDPTQYRDDYQNVWMAGFFGKLGLTGNRGFDALKLFRQERFNQIWDAFPESMQTPDNAKMVADSINHATGVVKMKFREWANWAFFAPKLEGSRWAWMIGDPYKAAKTFGNWAEASPAERAFAIRELKQKAEIAGVYMGLLAMNQGLLKATDSKQKVNFTDPRRSDFLAFKAGDYKFGIMGPMIGVVRLFANLVHSAVGKRTPLDMAAGSRADEFGSTAMSYLRGKASPFAGQVLNLVTQADFQNRPLPYSNDRVPAYLRREGIGKYTWPEYLAQEASPIPVSEVIREVWAKQGVDESTAAHWMKAITSGVVMGGTGARMSKDMDVRE